MKKITLATRYSLLARSRKGFSMIEIAAVIGIVVILSVVAFSNLSGRRNTVDLSSTTQQIATLLREAQSKSVSQTSGQAWGVHFENAATPFYSIFSGDTYSASAEAGHYRLPSNVCFSTIGSGSSQDVTFSQISGQPSGATSIGLQSSSGCSTAAGGGGGGGGLPSWSTTTSLSTSTYAHSAAVYNGYIYAIGGWVSYPSGVVTTTVLYAAINSNGTIGSWSKTTALPSAVQGPAIVNNGYMYTIGGYWNGGNYNTSTVFYAQINANGTIGSWAKTTALPAGVQANSAAVYNGYVYSIGGLANSGITSTVNYALINDANGTVGAWTKTASLPSQLLYHSVVASNGYIYTTGGGSDQSENGATTTVYYAQINGNGTLGSWSTTTPLPVDPRAPASVASNGYIYVTGGYNYHPAGMSSAVYYAQIASNGTVGSWSTGTPLPVGVYQHSAVVYNGYMYSTGGWGSAGPTSTVNYSLISIGAVAATSTINVSAQGQITF